MFSDVARRRSPFLPSLFQLLCSSRSAGYWGPNDDPSKKCEGSFTKHEAETDRLDATYSVEQLVYPVSCVAPNHTAPICFRYWFTGNPHEIIVKDTCPVHSSHDFAYVAEEGPWFTDPDGRVKTFSGGLNEFGVLFRNLSNGISPVHVSVVSVEIH